MTQQAQINKSTYHDSPQVIGFGALNMDRIFYVDRIVKPDEEGFINSIQNHPGGSAANTTVGLSRLGIKTGYIGKIADDDIGEILLEDLTSEGVNTSGIRIASGRSGACLIMVDSRGDRGILVDPGVNDNINTSDISMDYINSARLIHMTSFVCRESDVSFETQQKAAAHTCVQISLDPGTLYAQRGMDALIGFICKGSVILPNDHELRLMTGCKKISDGADMLINAGAAWVAVKTGKRGCYVTDGSLKVKIPANKVNVVDTTGAGDAFNAGFIYGMLQGRSIETCGMIGNLTASVSITHRGARRGLPFKHELDMLMEEL
jgi:ribokinase